MSRRVGQRPFDRTDLDLRASYHKLNHPARAIVVADSPNFPGNPIIYECLAGLPGQRKCPGFLGSLPFVVQVIHARHALAAQGNGVQAGLSVWPLE